MSILQAPIRHYTAYIDEAGDEGFGKISNPSGGGQSRWLVIGACVVTREYDLRLPSWRDQILQRFPLKKSQTLHFRDLKHDQRVVACQEIASKPLHVCTVLSHKVTLVGSKWENTFRQKGYLYNYLVRWLLERITTFCASYSHPYTASLKIVFSRRANTDYGAMREYLALMRDGDEVVRPVRSIDWKVLNIDDISVEDHSKWAGLQLADVITSGIFCGFEPNKYGNYEPRYAQILKPKLMRAKNGIALDLGFAPVPGWSQCRADAQQAALIQDLGRDGK